MVMMVSRMLMFATFMLAALSPTVAKRLVPVHPAANSAPKTKPAGSMKPMARVGPAMDWSNGPVSVPTMTGVLTAPITAADDVDDLESFGETTPFIDDAFTQEDFFGEHSVEEEHIKKAGTKDIDRKIKSLEQAQLMWKLKEMQSADLADLEEKGFATLVKDSLAADNSQSMPEEIRIAGEAAVDELAKSVLASFPEGGTELILTSDGAFAELVKVLGLDPIITVFDLTQFSTIAEYVAETTQAVKKNPILLQFARQFAKLPPDMRNEVFPTGAKADGEIRKAVVYSFLLNTIGKTLMNEPMKQPDGKELLYEKMVSIFDDMSDSREKEWKPHLNLFEKMKFASVVRPFLRNKTHTLTADKLDAAGLAQGEGIAGKIPPGLALSANIMEAMFQDEKQGNPANAQAGFELMVEPNGQGDLHDEEWIHEDGTRTGVRRWRMPLPRAWANLYSSWNGAFVSAYKDNPMFYAKLINPVTLGTYHTDEPGAEDLYLWTRAIQLYVHLQYIKMTRADAQSREPSTSDFRSNILTLLWGLVNEQASEAYHHRVEQTVKPSSEKERIHHQDLRAKAKVLWKGVRLGAKF